VAVGLVASTSRRFGNDSLNSREQTGLRSKTFREERAVADKPEFVDTIGDATRQYRRRSMLRVTIEPEVKERSRLSHWPPQRYVDWRTETFKPWKLKPWKTDG
jgi:hypothetical protein